MLLLVYSGIHHVVLITDVAVDGRAPFACAQQQRHLSDPSVRHVQSGRSLSQTVPGHGARTAAAALPGLYRCASLLLLFAWERFDLPVISDAALQLCTVGHELTAFQSEGWQYLQLLLTRRVIPGLLRTLLDIIPGLCVQIKQGETLPQLTQILADLCQVDVPSLASRMYRDTLPCVSSRLIVTLLQYWTRNFDRRVGLSLGYSCCAHGHTCIQHSDGGCAGRSADADALLACGACAGRRVVQASGGPRADERDRRDGNSHAAHRYRAGVPRGSV